MLGIVDHACMFGSVADVTEDGADVATVTEDGADVAIIRGIRDATEVL